MIGRKCSRHVSDNTFVKDFSLKNLKRSGCLGDLGIDWMLTLYSLAVTLRTTSFNIQKFYMVLALR